MAPVIAKAGFELDSSVKPSWLVRRRQGHGRMACGGKTLKDSGLVSRPWLCRYSLPTCGPALSIPFLAWNARKAWSELGPFVYPDEQRLQYTGTSLTTLGKTDSGNHL